MWLAGPSLGRELRARAPDEPHRSPAMIHSFPFLRSCPFAFSGMRVSCVKLNMCVLNTEQFELTDKQTCIDNEL